MLTRVQRHLPNIPTPLAGLALVGSLGHGLLRIVARRRETKE